MKVKQQNHIYAFLCLGLLIFTLLFCARGETAPCPFSKTVLTAAGEFSLPDRPTAPVPPTRPGEQKPKEKDAPKKTPAPPPKTVEKQAAKEQEKPPQKDQAAPQALPQPAAIQPDKITSVEMGEDAAPDNAQKKKPEEKEFPFLQAFIKNTLYAIALLSLIALTLYLYFTTPKDPAVKKNPNAPTAAPSKARPILPSYEKTAMTAALSNVKIMNKSLLEQLIRYDMETYGEIRSNLDYEQPAYVERLIRKYGGGDKNKINRAIHLFYANREKK